MKYTFQISNSWNTKKRKNFFESEVILKVTNMMKCKYICGVSDIDECKGNHSCHVNATCTNTNGSYVCVCEPGFNGNGQSCTGEFNVFAIKFRIFLIESNLKLLRWPLSAILLVCRMWTILVGPLVCSELSFNALSEKEGAQIQIKRISFGSPISLL